MPLYARAGVQECWLVDVRLRVVEVYRDPTPEGYRETQTVHMGGRLTVAALPAISISADEILA